MIALEIERSRANERMHQVRTLLTFIKTQESQSIPPVDSDDVKIIRGLFFVSLYGAFEKTINEVVEQYLRAVGGLKVEFSDLTWSFLPTALDPVLTSFKATGHWEKRVKIFETIQSEVPCTVSDTIFSDQLQNTWYKKLEQIALYIGVRNRFLRNQRDSHYVDEVVDKRNQVAHGRNTPLVIGSLGRALDLEIRFDAIDRVIDDYVAMLESHFNSLDFVREDRRNKYLNV